MRLYTIITFTVAVFVLSAAEKLTLPVTTCKRNSSDYNSCLKLAAEESWPRFVPGLPEFDFPSMDPLIYPYQKYVFKNNDLNGELIFRDMTVRGMKNLHIFSVTPHFRNNSFRLAINAVIPTLNSYGECVARGSMAGMQMGGKGFFNITANEIKGIWDLKGPVVNDTWTIERFHTLPTLDKFHIHLTDLFDGNKELNEFASSFVNEYWPMIYRLAAPGASKIWDKWLTDTANKLFPKVSFSKTFP